MSARTAQWAASGFMPARSGRTRNDLQQLRARLRRAEAAASGLKVAGQARQATEYLRAAERLRVARAAYLAALAAERAGATA